MLIIGIAGGTGSGKTTVVNKIAESFTEGEVAILYQDAYYYDNSHLSLEERRKKNFDHPESIEFPLMVEHIKALKEGHSIEQPTYSFISCTRQAETIRIEPRHVLIVEGILCLADESLRRLMDVKVFVDCASDVRLSRVIRRDIMERGRNVEMVLDRYEKTVRPSHMQFIEPTKNFADIIVPQGGLNLKAIEILTNYIKQILKKSLV
ncbi:MAG TPA: uridine kinase [Prolixibacteraceae bacterium]|jgi:uridine kinase|nr:uridine kinase [Bacteroidales bacterium]HNQ37609.1 uridine kinase [Prolixibacteraceae bacterium]HOY50178.1 uridine kinase [Prolixibacteraceae bacterium]HPJ79041.1 uridine kinase [Prolixibacteraceae bacterium]